MLSVLKNPQLVRTMDPFLNSLSTREYFPHYVQWLSLGLQIPGLLAPSWDDFERPSQLQNTVWLRTVGAVSQSSSPSAQSHFFFLLLALVPRALPHMLIYLKVCFPEDPICSTDDEELQSFWHHQIGKGYFCIGAVEHFKYVCLD